MGLVKQAYMEHLEREDAAEKLADLLEISYDDLMELTWEIEVDTSDDGQIYGYRVEFSKDSPEEILSEIPGLVDGCRVELEPWAFDDEYDYGEEEFYAIAENKEYLETYRNEISNLEALNMLAISGSGLKPVLRRQIYIGVIGVMETFLSDAFINLTFDHDEYFRNFVESHPDFKLRKFELREIIHEHEKLKETARTIVLNTIFHKLPSVSKMYQDTFKIDFPKITEVYKLVLTRHDLVHRNGKTKSGEIVEINNVVIKHLIDTVNDFVGEISAVLPAK